MREWPHTSQVAVVVRLSLTTQQVPLPHIHSQRICLPYIQVLSLIIHDFQTNALFRLGAMHDTFLSPGRRARSPWSLRQTRHQPEQKHQCASPGYLKRHVLDAK